MNLEEILEKYPPLNLSLAEKYAWWMITGEADPCLETRFVYRNPKSTLDLKKAAEHAQILIDEAEAAGIGSQFIAILERITEA